MARLLSPAGWFAATISGGNRLNSAAGATATVYADSARTTLADIRTYDGTNTPGPAITGSVLTVNSNSQLPQFWFPDGAATVWVVVGTGPIVAVDAVVSTSSSALGTVLNYATTGNPIASSVSGTETLITTTPSVTLRNSRAFKLTVRGQYKTTGSSAHIVRAKMGTAVGSPTLMDEGWQPTVLSADSFFQWQYEFVNTSGVDKSTQLTITGQGVSGQTVDYKGFSSGPFQVRVEDIGLASVHPGLASV